MAGITEIDLTHTDGDVEVEFRGSFAPWRDGPLHKDVESTTDNIKVKVGRRVNSIDYDGNDKRIGAKDRRDNKRENVLHYDGDDKRKEVS